MKVSLLRKQILVHVVKVEVCPFGNETGKASNRRTVHVARFDRVVFEMRVSL
jgi:hypothetical protein